MHHLEELAVIRVAEAAVVEPDEGVRDGVHVNLVGRVVGRQLVDQLVPLGILRGRVHTAEW